jgi:GntR family transcriptional regulator/MocR family aminotransferase
MASATPAGLAGLLVPLDRASSVPLHRQIYDGLRDAVLSGRLPAGTRVPSTRYLAQYLAVSRTTMLVAFDQLVAEGYLVGTVGSGTFVARSIPEHLLRGHRDGAGHGAVTDASPRLAGRVRELAALPHARRSGPDPTAFCLGVPPVDAFPVSVWSRLAGRRRRSLTPAQLYHGPPAGSLPLRDAIVAHLSATRGVRCTPDQVIVLSSAQEAMELCCRVLLDPGDRAWIEDPCWMGFRGALLAADARAVPVPVDAEGLVVGKGIEVAPGARLAYVTPSHQFPCGVTLSLERRLELLDWAARESAWVLEDDYDSEYRYSGHPLTALQGLDTRARVLYIGTFNKTVFPSLRLAYLVVPLALREAFLAARGQGGHHAPLVEQGILTDFIAQGHYARHLRRLRAIGRERRDVLIEAARRELPGVLEIAGAETGLHLVAWLPSGLDDRQVSDAAARQDVEALALSSFYVGACPRPGLVLGYASVPPREIRTAMRRLADAVRSVMSPS